MKKEHRELYHAAHALWYELRRSSTESDKTREARRRVCVALNAIDTAREHKKVPPA